LRLLTNPTQLILNASDAALNPVWCLNASFTE